MTEELIDFNLPVSEQSIIMVIGLGGGGTNAVNRMFEEGIRDVDFMVANTDAQSLAGSQIARRIQLGTALTEGLGAGNSAVVGEQAALENFDEIREALRQHARMAFIVAGMGGGTGTGAAPVVAKICRDLNILTVGVVTLPFRFEGPKRLRSAIEGINNLKQEVDALLIIHNEKLREIFGNKPISVAFANADEILMLAVKGIAEIITIHGYINVDFADVVSVMREGGIAFMGSATASGSDRARQVIDQTINSPLLNNNDIKGASRVLLNITSGQEEITVDEIGIITDIISEKVGGRVNTIWGTCTDENLTDDIRITLVATGFRDDAIPDWITVHPPRKEAVFLKDPQQVTLPDQEIIGSKDPETESIKQVDEKPDQTELTLNKDPDPGTEVFLNPEQESAPGAFMPRDTEPEFVVIETCSTQDDRADTMTQRHPDEDRKEELLRSLNYRNMSDPGKIDEAERIPAFRRKGSPVQDPLFHEEETRSRYTVGQDARLRPNNPYLHDAVD